jgi:tRNA (guanine-N(7)-)-methyltransferase subunit TRM82
LQTFSAQQDGLWQENAILSIAVAGLPSAISRKQVDAGGDVATDNSAGKGVEAAEKALRDMLYNVENLRKRPGAED